jgi:hypothetical protein
LSSSSLSPSSPTHINGGGGSSSSYLENRWERFERIRNKRRERIGAVRHSSNSSSHNHQQQHQQPHNNKLLLQPTPRPRQHTVESMVGRHNKDSQNADNDNNEDAARMMEEDDDDIDIGEEDSLSECGSNVGADNAAAKDSSENASPAASCATSFGPLQYTEADVLRALSSSSSDDAAADTPKKVQGDGGGGDVVKSTVENDRLDAADAAAMAHVGLRCPACCKTMHVPVLNVTCWHLKCERCWLRAVGTSQACTICHAAASVRELRKVQI